MSCHVATARAAALSAAFVLLLGSVSRVNAETTPVVLPPSFQQIDQGPAGGTVWQGRVPDPSVPKARRLTIIYPPPAVSSASRYPVVYLLHGFRGSPYEYAFGLHLAALADREIDGKAVRPFIAVAPPAGVNGKFHGEWSGAWEDYVVHDIVPWVDGHLPTVRSRRGRAIAGLSAGGYGAVDIGLRHPELFGTLESWSGYFKPFRDGSLYDGGPAELAAHDPSLLAQAESGLLHRLGTRSSSRLARPMTMPVRGEPSTSFASSLFSGFRTSSCSCPAAMTAPSGASSCRQPSPLH